MSLAPGTRLGPYEILASIGSGGMGEVYRARDTKLNREVAVKVLPESTADDGDRLRRFTLEAQSAGGLNHPNILVVHDVGSDRGIPYVVSELLEGRTLREALAGGALPPRKAVEYAIQTARGLAAAHDKGIVHRDLKPENIFVTRDGRVKILDFGLAKLTNPEGAVGGPNAAAETVALTVDGRTTPGIVLGTVGYMSPEQLRGEAVDPRSDIFSLGAVMYEMFSGVRAFPGKTAVEAMSAILKEDPPDLAAAATGASPVLDRVVRRCLEKDRDERFQSARDVTFALDALSNTGAASGQMAAAAGPPTRHRSLRLSAAAGAVTALIVGAAAFAAGRARAPHSSPQPTIRQLTFRSGTVRGARFTPDPRTVVYAAAWQGQPVELFSARQGSAESSAISLPAADLLAVSPAGEMAIALRTRQGNDFALTGTLARASVAGGAAREMLEGVFDADFSPDGSRLAVVRKDRSTFQVEYPIGTVLYSAPYWLSNPRIAPDGKGVAFITHPLGGDEGDVVIVDGNRQLRTLSPGWLSIQGLAWAPGGREVWFTATKSGGLRALWAATTAGAERLVYRAPQRLTLEDIAADGRVLLTGTTMRSEILFGSISQKFERKLSWFDWSTAVTLSPDTKMIAFTEGGEGAGEHYGVYVRPTDGSPAIRLADGSTGAISPDRKWVAAFTNDTNALQLLPTGAGQVRVPDVAPVQKITAVRWLPDGRLVMVGEEKGHAERAWVMSLAGGRPTSITPEGLTGSIVSPDGKWLFVKQASDNTRRLFPLGGGPLKDIGLSEDDSIAGWTADSRALLVTRESIPLNVERISIDTGRRTAVTSLTPSDPDGISFAGGLWFTPDGDHYVYGYGRLLGELFVIEGLK
jgi:WD40 repeat protein